MRKSRFEITNSNYKIYMLLELFNIINRDDQINIDEIIHFVKVNQIQIKDICYYMDYFPGKVAKNFNRSGLIYEIIQ